MTDTDYEESGSERETMIGSDDYVVCLMIIFFLIFLPVIRGRTAQTSLVSMFFKSPVKK